MRSFQPCWQIHHSYYYFVFCAVFFDTPSTEFQIFNIIQRIKVADYISIVLSKHFCVQIYYLTASSIQSDGIYTTAQSLKHSVLASCLSKFIHHVKSIFIQIKKQALKSRTTAKLKVANASLTRCANCWQEVVHSYPCAKDALKAITKSSVHNINVFFCHFFPLKNFLRNSSKKIAYFLNNLVIFLLFVYNFLKTSKVNCEKSLNFTFFSPYYSRSWCCFGSQ